MWAVTYGGKFDGLAVLVADDTMVLRFPENFDLKKHPDHDFSEGEFAYERTDTKAVGWNISGSKQQGVAFTPKVLEVIG